MLTFLFAMQILFFSVSICVDGLCSAVFKVFHFIIVLQRMRNDQSLGTHLTDIVDLSMTPTITGILVQVDGM